MHVLLLVVNFFLLARNIFHLMPVTWVVISAIGKILAAELPHHGNARCTILYPASAKAGNEIGENYKYMIPPHFPSYRIISANQV